MANGTKWFEPKTSKTMATKLLKDYNEIVKSTMGLSTVLEKYVNVDKKWADNTSEIFAEWWNPDGQKGGELQFVNKELKTTKSKTNNDGEDRIKFIVNLAGAAYYGAVCMPLQALVSSYKKDIESAGLTNQANLGKNATYLANFKTVAKSGAINSKITGDSWNNMMEKSLKSEVWKHKKLKTTRKKTDVTTTNAMASLIKDINVKTKAIMTAVQTYRKDLNSLVNNNTTGNYWGMDRLTVGNMGQVIDRLADLTENKLENFTNNLYTALLTCDNCQSADLKKLKTDFDL